VNLSFFYRPTKLILFRNSNFQDDNDGLLRCPVTPAFTAPECCSGTFIIISMNPKVAFGFVSHDIRDIYKRDGKVFD
jgi:hypothetical protein